MVDRTRNPSRFGWLALLIGLIAWLVGLGFTFVIWFADQGRGFNIPNEEAQLHVLTFFGVWAAIGVGFALHALRVGQRRTRIAWVSLVVNLTFLTLVLLRFMWPR
jgi:hypothetical protein